MPDDLAPNVLVASTAEASRGAEHVWVGNVSGANLDNIDIEGIRALHCVVMGYKDDAGVLSGHKTAYVWTETHGPWLRQFPADFVAALANLPSDHFREIGRRWWERLWEDDEEEVRAEMLSQAPIDRIERQVGILVALARTAIHQNKNLYWKVPGC